MNRRDFLKYASASATAFTIVPSHVLGASGQTPPSEKITLALIGCGTEGLREMVGVIAQPEVQMVAACDPNKDSTNYLDWSKDGLRSSIAEAIGKGLGLPSKSVSAAQAPQYLGALAHFAQASNPSSSERTRALLTWEPTHAGLLADLAERHYFVAPQ